MRVLYFFLFGASNAMFSALTRALWSAKAAAAEDDETAVPDRVVDDDELRANLAHMKARLEAARLDSPPTTTTEGPTIAAVMPPLDSPVTDREEPSPLASESSPRGRARTASDSIPIPKKSFSFEHSDLRMAFSPRDGEREAYRRALRSAFVPPELRQTAEEEHGMVPVGSFRKLQRGGLVYFPQEMIPTTTEAPAELSEEAEEEDVSDLSDVEEAPANAADDGMELFMGDLDE